MALFSERLVLVNGTPLTSAADLVALLEKNGWRRGYCDPALWPGLQAAFPATFTVETLFDRSRVDDYQFGGGAGMYGGKGDQYNVAGVHGTLL